MTSRAQTLSIALVGVVVGACSRPSAENAGSEAQTLERVPTIEAALPAAGQSLVSPLEAGQRTELTLVRPAERKQPQPVVVNGKGDAPGTEVQAHSQSPTLDLGEVTPNVVASAAATTADAPIAPALGPLPHGPMPGASEGSGAGNSGGRRDPAFYPDRPTILIRGGMGGIHDDCKNHPQGYPAGGIAINSRMPQVGSTPVAANNPTRPPFSPGRIGGGYGVPRRGIIR